MKKILLGISIAAIFLCLAGVMLVRHWADTGHGRLDTKVAVILKFMQFRNGDEESLPSVAESRQRLLDTVKKYSSDPIPVGRVSEQSLPGPSGPIPVRIYASGRAEKLPVVLFYHGGGWVQGDLDSHDNLCRYLAAASGALVASVAYRLAPEHPFPAGVEDAYTALVWMSENAGTLGGDPKRIAVMGDSAGGNISAALCLMARDRKGPKITRQVLVYPATDLSRLDTDSYAFFGRGFMLTKEKIEWFRQLYLPDPGDWTNPLASPLLASDHSDLPPATIITAQMDPLRDDGKRYAEKLKKTGTGARYHCYAGMIHGFVSADKMLGQAHEALDEIARDLKISFHPGN